MITKQQTPSFLPLYEQIKRLITRSLSDGEWQPGAMIPSEMALARRYGVSQGTVRKAINELVAENMLVRRQGRGTFVATHTDDGTSYRFLHLRNLAGEQAYPQSDFIGFGRGKADAAVARRLGVRSGSALVQIQRILNLSGNAVVYDDIRLPAALLKGISSAMVEEHVNAYRGTLYSLYETQYQIRIISAEERIRATLADARVAGLLGVMEGMPLLAIERVAFTYKNQPVEWRMSYVNTENHYYFDELN
ncbi:GntR family transcriptional regulator [Halothiobacillus diazotrophicus]|uniref:GntR family transcriptional regulator n=1 Tax=Halothiobacillus diazotrophicus TaxID=1860122 RepID=A0A191ZHY8_9GAMM|nr:GntR family transcriptional regulator [Halothiobacillus diazotrophicus]ANJ67480.1 GntR family transcriptional regulator [Halothiobacillus diazotrophicus]